MYGYPSAAYFVPATVNQLRTVDEIPALAHIRPPDGMYTSAKLGKGRARGEYYSNDIHSAGGPSMSPQQYPPPPTYTPYPGQPPPPGGSHSPQAMRVPAWPGQSPPHMGRDPQTLPNPARLLPPPALGLTPAPPVQSPYSPRHPLDDEALRSLGRRL